MFCDYCTVVINLRVTASDQNLDVTSDHLDVEPVGIGGMNYDEAETGEELSKRVENFGHPVGRGMLLKVMFSTTNVANIVQGDPTRRPVLICRLRPGQEIRIKCLARKVQGIRFTFLGLFIEHYSGDSKRTRKMVSLLCCRF